MMYIFLVSMFFASYPLIFLRITEAGDGVRAILSLLINNAGF